MELGVILNHINGPGLECYGLLTIAVRFSCCFCNHLESTQVELPMHRMASHTTGKMTHLGEDTW